MEAVLRLGSRFERRDREKAAPGVFNQEGLAHSFMLPAVDSVRLVVLKKDSTQLI